MHARTKDQCQKNGVDPLVHYQYATFAALHRKNIRGNLELTNLSLFDDNRYALLYWSLYIIALCG